MDRTAKVCWRCGREWEEKRSPSHSEDCLGCHQPLHCCRNCRFYDDRMSMWCREPQAREERPRDPEQGNRCSYFVFAERPAAERQRAPSLGMGEGSARREEEARSALDDIFKPEA
ncbi:MAG: hypothetical protein N3A66_00970 [Planctomycetota bacterium]|nr:hypothetical protein [Planctomycetota bacterium]